jgi:hypothetical protein
MTTEFILTYLIFAFASVGIGNLYLYLIRPAQLFAFMQKPLAYFSDKPGILSKFIYKSIGGCGVCTVQRFTDLTFAFLIYHFELPGQTWAVCLEWFGFYILFGGLSFYAQALAQKQPNETIKNIDL